MSKQDHQPTHYHERPSSGRTVEENYQSGYAKCVPPGRLLTPAEMYRLRSEQPRRLAKYREAADLTQAELGALLGLTRQACSRYETGSCSPDITVYACLAKLYHTSLDRLVWQDPPSASQPTSESKNRRG